MTFGEAAQVVATALFKPRCNRREVRRRLERSSNGHGQTFDGGGEVAQAKVYVVARLVGPQAALVPVTLRFVSDAQTLQPEMVVVFGDEQVVYRNEQGTFHPPLAHA